MSKAKMQYYNKYYSNNGEIYSFFINLEPGFFSCSYQYLIDMPKEGMSFPDFSYSIQGNSKDLDFTRKYMLFLYTQKRRISFIKRVFSMKCAGSKIKGNRQKMCLIPD